MDPFESYLAMLREQRKTAREREIEKELAEIFMKHKHAMDAEAAPLLAEMTKINALKEPLPVMVDGKVYEYVQPKAI